MPATIDAIRDDFAAREDQLAIFEVFSGTMTPGEDGAPAMPAPGEDDPGLPVSDSLAIASFTSLGLTGISYALMRYGKAKPVEPVLEPMRLLHEKIQIGKALEAAQSGRDVTRLMELLPYVGVPTKRMNIEAIWEEVADVLAIMQLNVDAATNAMERIDKGYDGLHAVGKAGFIGFGALSALGTAATVLTATLHDRAVPLVDDLEAAAGKLDGRSARKAEKAAAEFAYRSSEALSGLDGTLREVAELAEALPDLQDLVDLIADAEALFDPLIEVSGEIAGLVQPYEDFLGVAKVIGAPIEGVLALFENPPKVLPTIVGYETITPGFWLTVPDPTWSDPFRTKQVWVDPVTVPIFGLKELFDPIPREEVQKIIDTILTIAGLPQELLEKALAPILTPIQNEVDKILRPIIETLNPFDDYLEDFTLAEETLAALRETLDAAVAKIEAAVARLSGIGPDLDPVEEVGEIDADGMATFFGTDAAETILGAVPEAGGGSMNGAVIAGNGGADTIVGTRRDDLLGGGPGKDAVSGKGGADLLLGGDGSDFLHGGGGGDIVMGGGGGDEMVGGGGKDDMHGGAGHDEIAGRNGRDHLAGGSGKDLILGGNGHDAMFGGRGHDDLFGGDGKDRLVGGGGRDELSGGKGHDRLVGGGGRDELIGGKGHDRLAGGGGRDELVGGKGRDVLEGGAGADRFVFETVGDTSRSFRKSDLIVDFEEDVDLLFLRAVDASEGGGNGRFKWRGEDDGFGTHAAGEVFFEHVDLAGRKNDVTVVYLDTDGDAAHEGVIRMAGLIDLDRADIVL